jgi:site-specific recombinase XerD
MAHEHKPSTINRRLIALHRFFLWAKKRGHIYTQPSERDLERTVRRAAGELMEEDYHSLVLFLSTDEGAPWVRHKLQRSWQKLPTRGARVQENSDVALRRLE